MYLFIPLVVLLLLGIPEMLSAKAKQGKNCLDCHDSLKEKILQGKAHKPVLEGNCIVCHNPHASNYEGLLSISSDKLCYKCHTKDKISILDGTMIHTPVKTGNCGACHDPHSSKNDKLLVTKEKGLCYECHKEEYDATEKETHHLVSKGECAVCHEPHSSFESGLLVKKVGFLCSGCHDVNAGQIFNAHSDYKIGESNCSTCHNVHSSDNKNLLKASIHLPLEEKNCTGCHNSADSSKPLALKSRGTELCYDCHQETRKSFEKPNNHVLGNRANFCLNCHNPHASDSKSLLEKSEEAVCFECHMDTMARVVDEKTPFKHPKLNDCSTCHTAHGSDNELFLTANENEFCSTGKCHQAQLTFTHPIGPDTPDPRSNKEMNCITCHDPMGTGYKYNLRLDPDNDLCLQCHRL